KHRVSCNRERRDGRPRSLVSPGALILDRDVSRHVWGGVIDRYREHLPIGPSDKIVTLCEGNTPLVRADRLAAVVAPGIELYLKCEGQNPTGSFKDRGMTMAVSRAASEGIEAIICASTGNTSAAASAPTSSSRTGISPSGSCRRP